MTRLPFLALALIPLGACSSIEKATGIPVETQISCASAFLDVYGTAEYAALSNAEKAALAAGDCLVPQTDEVVTVTGATLEPAS